MKGSGRGGRRRRLLPGPASPRRGRRTAGCGPCSGGCSGTGTAEEAAAAKILAECDGADLHLRLGLTAFKHVGVFPEQAPNWDFIYRQVARLRANNIKRGVAQPPRVLNLFAYTGAASLAAKAAGADVTHLDSVRQVVTWARHNMEISSLDGIRWTIDEASSSTLPPTAAARTESAGSWTSA